MSNGLGVSTGSASLIGKASTVSVFRVSDAGGLTLAGSGSIDSQGRYLLDEVEDGAGPFLVQANQGETVVGQVIVPGDIRVEATTVAAPMSVETTFEAAAYLSLLAGEYDRSGVDRIALMTWITSNVAATADAEVAAQAYMNGQRAWLRVAANADHTISVAARKAAAMSAWTTASIALDGANLADVERQVWADFPLSAATALTAVDVHTKADAQAAAAVMFQAAFPTGTPAAANATASAMILTASADHAAQIAAADGSSAKVAILASLDGSYRVFATDVNEATTTAEFGDAYASLAIAISGQSSADPSLSALGLFTNAAGAGSDQAAVQTAVARTVSLSGVLDAAIAASIASSVDAKVQADAVADATSDYRDDVDASIAASFAATLEGDNAALATLASTVAAQSGGHGSVLVDLRTNLFATIGIPLGGLRDTGYGFQTGANALGTSTFDAALTATTAVLMMLDATGHATTVSHGTFDATAHTFAFTNVENVQAANASGALFVQDAQGEITGAGRVDRFAENATSGSITLTEETTAEAQIVFDLTARGMAESDIDYSFLETYVDAAVVASATSGADIHALASAVAAGSAVRAQALGTTLAAMHDASLRATADLHASLHASPAQAAAAQTAFRAALAASVSATSSADASRLGRVEVQSAQVFTSVVSHIRADSRLAMAAQARARIESAFSLDTAVTAAFMSTDFLAARTTETHAAAVALELATTTAASGAQLDIAANVFVDALLGFASVGHLADGVLGKILADGLLLTPVAQLSVQGDVNDAFVAGEAFQSSLDAAISAQTTRWRYQHRRRRECRRERQSGPRDVAHQRACLRGSDDRFGRRPHRSRRVHRTRLDRLSRRLRRQLVLTLIPFRYSRVEQARVSHARSARGFAQEPYMHPVASMSLALALSACASTTPSSSKVDTRVSSSTEVDLDTSISSACGLKLDRAYFPYASAMVSDDDKSTIAKLATCMKSGGSLAKRAILTTGYADADGGTGYNSGLAITRGDSVAAELKVQGIEANRIYVRSMGERSANPTMDANKAYDRRVEIRVIELP